MIFKKNTTEKNVVKQSPSNAPLFKTKHYNKTEHFIPTRMAMVKKTDRNKC